MNPTLSIIILSLSGVELQLKKTLSSLRDQGLSHHDEVIVITNGEQELSRVAWRKSGLSGKLILCEKGLSIIPAGATISSCDYHVFCRDGDEWLAASIEYVRISVVNAGPPACQHLFMNTMAVEDGLHARTALSPKIHPGGAKPQSHNGVVIKSFVPPAQTPQGL